MFREVKESSMDAAKVQKDEGRSSALLKRLRETFIERADCHAAVVLIAFLCYRTYY